MVYLILSVDYEIFGNGSGDVVACMINPTSEILNICERYGAKLTIFFEVCEYWAFKEAQKAGKLEHLDYCPATEMEWQAIDAVQRGHDVQLHIHPQWLNWKCENGQWQVDLSLWRISALSSDDCINIFRRGKKTLETLLQPITSKYRCVVFRAGGWCIQPEENVLAAMVQAGFEADSTVAPEIQFNDGITAYDFRNSPTRPAWKISKSITREEPKGSLWEVPISTRCFHIWERDFRAKIRRRIKRLPTCPKGCSGEVLGMLHRTNKTWVNKLKNLFKSKLIMFDISLGASEMLAFVTSALQAEPSRTVYPLVAIGHPKRFGNAYELDSFLRKCQPWVAKGVLKFATFSELLSALHVGS